MGTEEDGSKRFVGGPRAVGALVPALVRPVLRGRSPSATQLLADWPAVVGPALAAVTQPRRLSGSTLVLACSGPIALELQHMSGELVARINAHLGRRAVTALRFVQEALPQPALPPAPPAEGPLPEVPGVAAGPLHDALARLGRAVARRR